jgi:hypothetical protein
MPCDQLMHMIVLCRTIFVFGDVNTFVEKKKKQWSLSFSEHKIKAMAENADANTIITFKYLHPHPCLHHTIISQLLNTVIIGYMYMR